MKVCVFLLLGGLLVACSADDDSNSSSLPVSVETSPSGPIEESVSVIDNFETIDPRGSFAEYLKSAEGKRLFDSSEPDDVYLQHVKLRDLALAPPAVDPDFYFENNRSTPSWSEFMEKTFKTHQENNTLFIDSVGNPTTHKISNIEGLNKIEGESYLEGQKVTFSDCWVKTSSAINSSGEIKSEMPVTAKLNVVMLFQQGEWKVEKIDLASEFVEGAVGCEETES